MQKNYYQILRISNTATTEEIGFAHHRAIQRIAGSGIDDPDTRALLQTAVDTLSDPAARASYDQSLAAPEPVIRLGTSASPLQMESAAGDESDDDDSGKPRGLTRIVYVLGFFLLGALLIYPLLRKSPPPPAMQTTIADAPTTSDSAPSATPQAPATNVEPQNNVKAKPRTADQIFADVSASIVRINVLDAGGNVIGGGSGVVTARSTVVTNCHVALKGPVVTVRAAKQDFPASIEIADESFDLCQLSVSGGFSAPSVEVGNMKYVRPGQTVFAIGSPQGLDLSISEGIVSSVRESRLGPLIQTTAAISPGSSGGGLFNVSGQLIGFTTFQSKTGQNLNFAVPADWIADMQTRGGPGPSLE